MAIVYRAVVAGAGELARPVVIKRVRPELARDPSFAKMLTQEARLYAMLSHPSIIQLQELGQVGAECFMAMEYVDGVDLRAVLHHCKAVGEQMPIGVACYIVSEIASALDYAHTLKDSSSRPLEIVHRDVSPSNIMVTPQGAVKLLDFGIAKAAEHMRDERTRTGTIKGKLAYFSPEQADGLDLDGRSDIFALGIVLVELLSLQRVFRGSGDFETLRRVREARVPPLSTLRADAAADLQEVVSKMLARLPEERYANAREVVEALRPVKHAHHGDAEALRRFLEMLGPIPRRIESDQIQAVVQSDSVQNVLATNGSPWLRRILFVGAGATIFAAAAGSFVVTRKQAHSAPPVVVQPVAPVARPAAAPTSTIDPPPLADLSTATTTTAITKAPPLVEPVRTKRKPSHTKPHRAVHSDDANEVKDPFAK